METTHSAVEPRAVAMMYPWFPTVVVAALAASEVVIGLALARRGVRFDGFMDVHRTALGSPVPLIEAIADQVAAIIIPLFVVLAVLRAWSVTPGGVSGAAIAVVARIPVVLVGAVILWMPVPAILAHTQVASVGALRPDIVLPALAALACVITSYTLVVVGLRRATRARGWSLALQSIGVFFLAELCGKVALLLV